MLRTTPVGIAPAFAAEPQSSLLTFWRLSGSALTPDVRSSLARRARFAMRARLQRQHSLAWLSRLAQPDLAPLWQSRPRLATKLQRAYIRADWNTARRCQAVLSHYEVMPALLSPWARLAIYSSGLPLVRIQPAGSLGPLDLRLYYHDRFEKEGDLTLDLWDSQSGLSLAALTFSLGREDGVRTAVVGGIQSQNDPRTRALIHDTAKALHGMRPKALVLWALQHALATWKVGRLQAVDDRRHAWRHWRRRRSFASSYDQFWAECGGQPLPDGGWTLPLSPPVRERSELKPSRRKAHDRRAGMLAALVVPLRSAVAHLATAHQLPPPPVFEIDRP